MIVILLYFLCDNQIYLKILFTFRFLIFNPEKCDQKLTSPEFFRSYFFSVEVLGKIFEEAGFIVLTNCYINRRTVNIKEGIDVPRIFIQAKLQKPS